MKPRNGTRSFGCPPLVWFDDPEAVHHWTGKSVDTLERWATDGLRIHSAKRGSRLYRYVVMTEFLAFLDVIERAGSNLIRGTPHSGSASKGRAGSNDSGCGSPRPMRSRQPP